MKKEALYFKDRIYGVAKIEEPVLIDLIKSPEVSRLQKINQHGLPEKYLKMPGYSRYEHSLGVMLLLRNFGASLSEQVAGLLHDVNHQAFSHLYEWVKGQQYLENNPQDLQDQELAGFIRKSTLPEILNNHGYSVEDVTSHHKHTLLEQPSPQLCADRIDYTLRDLPAETAQTILQSLTVHNGRFINKDATSALYFGNNFLDIQQNVSGSEQAAARYQLFVHAVRKAFTLGLLEESDFRTNDEQVLSKITDCNDPEINQILSELTHDHIVLPRLHETVHVKYRRIDPQILHEGKLVPVSHFNPEFAHRLKLEEQRCYKGILV